MWQGTRPSMVTHPLTVYLSARGEKLYAFAKRAKVPGTSIARALAGERGLSLDTALLIEKATKGAVPVSSWGRSQSKHAA